VTSQKPLSVLLAAGLLLHAADGVRAQPSIPAPIHWLEQYARGDGERATASLATLPHERLENLGKEIQKAARTWLQEKDPAVARRKRLAAATLALDVANAGLLEEWRVLRGLVEWGCELVRRNPAGPSEHTWHLASVALAGGALDKYFLIDSPGRSPTENVINHVRHAEAQFPGDSQWKLARAMALEIGKMAEGVRDAIAPNIWIGPEVRAANRNVVTAFEGVLTDPGLSAEAHLHLGHLRFVLREPDKAIHHYQEAARLARDPYVEYLAYFLAARFFDSRFDAAAAARHYRRALEILPNVQSAAIAVAAARLVDGAPDEAYAIVEAALSTNPRPPDPWRLFFLGNYRLWPSLIQRLRAELR
jgi:tetratricopeptide (TPR) repeat protein